MNRRALYLIFLAQVLLLAELYADRALGLRGETIRLRTVPVDPRDLLRGDYVILGYEISRIPDAAGNTGVTDGRCFVLLRRVDGFGLIDQITPTLEAAQKLQRTEWPSRFTEINNEIQRMNGLLPK